MSLRRPRFIVVACRGNRTPRYGNNSDLDHAGYVVHDTWLCGKIVASFPTEAIRTGDRHRRQRERAKRECERLNEAYG